MLLPMFIDSNISKQVYNNSGWVLNVLVGLLVLVNLIVIFFVLIFDIAKMIAKYWRERKERLREMNRNKKKVQSSFETE